MEFGDEIKEEGRFEKGTSRRVRKDFKEVEKGSTLPGR
jgi:hypothetical protein